MSQHEPPVMIGRHVPQCHYIPNVQRGYYKTQCHGDLCWCVDEQGQPIHQSLSHGDPQCNLNGMCPSVAHYLLRPNDLRQIILIG